MIPHTSPGAPRAALVVGHPGHELRVYGWMVTARPRVHVLTDGSGHNGIARLDSTTSVLRSAGAPFGSVYGRMSDREIYAAMLAGEHERFLSLAEELAADFIAEGVDLVAGDAIEGYNPSHDVCRYVINAAIRIATAESGRAIASYDFPLVAHPDSCPRHLRDRALTLRLDDQLLGRKLEAAKGYPELAAEVEYALREFGTEPFRTECLRPVDHTDPYGIDATTAPFYETYGENRVASGAYDDVVRFRRHVQPLADALWSYRAVPS